MVCVQGKQRFIGEAAISMARMHYKNTATDIKRLIGRKFKHPEVQQEIAQLAYKCVELASGDVGIVLNYNDEPVTFSCEQVVAMILNKMQNIAAAANEGVNPAYCVLSCPGFYTDVQRRALLNATKIAGLNCLRLINEHTAIALAYGIYKSARNLFHESEPQHVMFIDLGHASYTVSIVAFVQGRLTVKSAAFDRFLGGRDFDMVIAMTPRPSSPPSTRPTRLRTPSRASSCCRPVRRPRRTSAPTVSRRRTSTSSAWLTTATTTRR